MNLDAFSGLNLNRYLGVQNPDPTMGLSTPFQGIQSGIGVGTSTQNNPYLNSPSYTQPTGLEAGSLLTDVTVRSSSGGNYIPSAGILNGRVEMNRGYVDAIGQPFPFDSLTAFDPNGAASVIMFYGGIIFSAETLGGINVPKIAYEYGGAPYYQPIAFGTGTVFSDGTFPLDNFPSTWGCVHTGTGTYTITPTTPFPNDTYQVLLTSNLNAPTFIQALNILTTSFDVNTFDQTGAPVDSGFSFALFTNLT